MTSAITPVRDRAVSQATHRSPLGRRRRFTYGSLLLPSFLLILAINVYPLVFAIQTVLHGGSLLRPGNYVGSENFTQIFGDTVFWESVQFTVLLTAVTVGGSWIVGLGLALILRIDFPGRSLIRVTLLLPWVVPIIVSVTSWRNLMGTDQSPLVGLASTLGFGHVLFLGTPSLAVATLCFVKVWMTFPYMMLMMSAALEGTDPSVYEAATIDGATGIQQLRLVTLPIIARPTYITCLMTALFTINDFATVYLLTGGGPLGSTQTVAVYAYNLVFTNFKPGLGMAVAFLTTAVMIAVSCGLFVMIRRSFTSNN